MSEKGFGPKVPAAEAVDDEVDGGVEDEHQLGEEAEDDHPDREPAQVGAPGTSHPAQHSRQSSG